MADQVVAAYNEFTDPIPPVVHKNPDPLSLFNICANRLVFGPNAEWQLSGELLCQHVVRYENELDDFLKLCSYGLDNVDEYRRKIRANAVIYEELSVQRPFNLTATVLRLKNQVPSVDYFVICVLSGMIKEARALWNDELTSLGDNVLVKPHIKYDRMLLDEFVGWLRYNENADGREPYELPYEDFAVEAATYGLNRLSLKCIERLFATENFITNNDFHGDRFITRCAYVALRGEHDAAPMLNAIWRVDDYRKAFDFEFLWEFLMEEGTRGDAWRNDDEFKVNNVILMMKYCGRCPLAEIAVIFYVLSYSDEDIAPIDALLERRLGESEDPADRRDWDTYKRIRKITEISDEELKAKLQSRKHVFIRDIPEDGFKTY